MFKRLMSFVLVSTLFIGLLPLAQVASATGSIAQVNFVNVYPTEAYANSKIKVVGQPGAVYTFRQTTSNGQFTLQGNDIPGILNDGTRDIAGSIVRRDSDGGTTYSIWFQPTTPGNGVAAGYFLVLNGLNRTYTNNQLVQVNSANLSDIVTTLNQYLAAQQTELASAPTVNPLVTADTTPTLTGTVNLSTSGSSIEVVVNGQTYTTSNGVTVSGNTWSLTIPNGNALNYQTYEVTAKLVRPNTYPLVDGTSNELTITNAPYVQSLAITSTPSTANAKSSSHNEADKIYLTGETIEVTTTFSSVVTVTGTPKLAIKIGSSVVQASYVSGSGTSAIKFQYVVQAGQVDTDGVSIPQDAISLNGGTIKDNTQQNAILLNDSLADNPNHKVDTKAPQLLSLDYSSTNGSFIVMQYSDDFNLEDLAGGGGSSPNKRPDLAQFTISKTSGGTTTTHTAVGLSVDAANKKVTLDLGALSVSQGDTLRLSYVDAQGYNDIQDISGNDAAPFSLQLVNLDADDIDGIASDIESAGKNSGDANGDGILDKKQNAIVQAPLTNKADFDARSSSSNVNTFGTIAAGNLSQANRAAALTGNSLQLMTNTKISNVNMQSRNQLTGSGRNNVIAKSDVYEFNLVPESGNLVDLDPNTTGTQVRVVIDLPTPIAADTYMKKKSVNGTDVWFPFLDDQNLSTYDSGATLVKDNNGLVTRVVLTITDGGLGDYDGLANNVIVDPGFLAETDKSVVITMSDYALTNGETSLVTFTFADQVLGFTASDITVENGTLGTLTGPFTNTDGTVYYTALFTPTPNFVDATNLVTVAANSYTDLFNTNGTGGTSPNYTIDTTVPTPGPSDYLVVGPLDMTDATDSGPAQDDEYTSNGNPVLFFTGEAGLKIDLQGPGGVPLIEGQHYTVTYSNGVYTVTLLDAVPGGTANPFGTYANGVATNNPAGTGDGTYTIFATDLGGNRGTVGTFVIDTTPADLNPGPSPAKVGPLDMTDATDSGASADDEITNNGNPVLTFPGEPGLKIELQGPGGVPLIEGQHYTVTYANGVYTVTLLDAVPGGAANPFGTYSNGVATNNPSGTGDGTYTIFAVDKAGNRATVGTFIIDTTPADLNSGPSPAKVGPLDMTNATDSGASADDEITSNGNPELFFTGEAGLTIELYGPDQTKLVEGQHYSVAYANGIYTVKLIDAVPGGAVNPFGTYAFNGASGNPAATADGEYTIKAVDKAGNRGTVGTFVIDTSLLKSKEGAHKPYIKGYPDETFRAERGITRAEIATIVYRTITKAKSNAVIAYSDVKANFWGKAAIDAATQMGILTGYEDGTFGANQKITRAEFATIIARLLGNVNGTESRFGDVDSSHWAYSNIQKVAASGLITGYTDGSFKPDAYLTRAEAVTIYNRFLNRGPLAGVAKSTWDDVAKTHWALKDIEEASVQHGFEIQADLREYLK